MLSMLEFFVLEVECLNLSFFNLGSYHCVDNNLFCTLCKITTLTLRFGVAAHAEAVQVWLNVQITNLN